MTNRASLSRGAWLVLAVAYFGHAVAAMLYARWNVSGDLRGAIYFASKLVVNALPLVWVLAIERRRLSIHAPTLRDVAAGLSAGVVIAGAITAFYFIALAGRLDAQALRDKTAAYGLVDHFFLFAPFICLINAALEEYYWRWFVFGMIRRVLPLGAAAVISAVGFTLHHIVVLSVYFGGGSMIVLLNIGVFAGGVIWAVLYEKRGSIWASWISHALADAAIMIAAYDLLFRAASLPPKGLAIP